MEQTAKRTSRRRGWKTRPADDGAFQGSSIPPPSTPEQNKNLAQGRTIEPINDAGALPYSSLEGRLDSHLLRALQVMNYQFMTPVQEKVLTQMPNFSSDCLVRAKTGTGKTLAFLLPSLHSLIHSQPLPRGKVGVLVISPTRELALQIAKECDQLTSQMKMPPECHTAFGGTARSSNLNKFLQGAPSILVATPGRLFDYLSEPTVATKFTHVRTLILDEADTMLEHGFLQSIKDILKKLPPKQEAQWQGMCFSATMPDRIRDMLHVVLKPDFTSLSTVDDNEVPTIDRVPQFHVIMPTHANMFNTLASLLDFESRTSSKILVFGITANLVALFAKLFSNGLLRLKVFELHSRLNQNVRTKTTAEFKATGEGVLFASDVVGRGMDFPNVDLVIQVGLPSSEEQYVHRVGRTGRAENSGRAVMLLCQSETFFLQRHPKLPIHPHPQSAEIIAGAGKSVAAVQQSMYAIDEIVKQKAYSSFLGFFAGSGLLKPLHLDKAGLVRLANDFATSAMYCPEPPAMEKKTVGKMGLKGVPGLRYANPSADVAPGRAPRGGKWREDERQMAAAAVRNSIGGRGSLA